MPTELHHIIFSFYALQIILFQKAMKICHDGKLKDGVKLLAFEFNINNDLKDINPNPCNPNGI